MSLRLVVILLARHGPPATTIAGRLAKARRRSAAKSTAIDPRYRALASRSVGCRSRRSRDEGHHRQAGYREMLRLPDPETRRIPTWAVVGPRNSGQQRCPRTTKPPAV